MLPFKRILFPVDYSDRCRLVIPYVQEETEAVVRAAAALAASYHARLSLVHVG